MTAEADIFVDVDIPGLTPEVDTSIRLGIDAVMAKAPAPQGDDVAAALEQITKDRDAWKQRAEGGATQSLAQIAEERRRTEAAEARAGQAAEGELRAKWSESVNLHERLAAGVIQTRELITATEQALARAHADDSLPPEERGRRIAEAHTKLALAANDLRTLEQGEVEAKNQIEHMKRTIQASRTPPPETRPPVQAQPEPPRKETPDQWIARFPAKTQEWLRSHQDFVSNEALNKKLVTFAEDYHDGGSKALHDDNFIAALNKRFGFGEAEVKDVPVLEIDTTNHASTRAAAPVSRNNAPTGNNNAITPTGRVRLSGEERDTAFAMYPDLDSNAAIKRYAENKAQAIRDGKYAR